LFPEVAKQKEKRGSWPLSKIGDGPHQNQNQNRKENRVLTFKLVLSNSLLLKFQAFHFSSSKLPKPNRSTYW